MGLFSIAYLKLALHAVSVTGRIIELMRPILPFEPPNQSPCIALYHPKKNLWWLVLGHYDDPGLPAWKRAIKESGGTLKDYWTMASSIEHHGWPHIQATARSLEKEGFLRISGSLLEIGPAGTRWLQCYPKCWWSMQSASKEQLQVIRALPDGSEMVLTALARQGHFGTNPSPRGKPGPSVVEHRWKEVFPKEMAFALQCKSLGLPFKDAMLLWKSIDVNVETPPDMDLGDLLDMRPA